MYPRNHSLAFCLEKSIKRFHLTLIIMEWGKFPADFRLFLKFFVGHFLISICNQDSYQYENTFKVFAYILLQSEQKSNYNTISIFLPLTKYKRKPNKLNLKGKTDYFFIQQFTSICSYMGILLILVPKVYVTKWYVIIIAFTCG